MTGFKSSSCTVLSAKVEQYQDLLVSHLEDYHRLKRMIDSMLFLARADQKMV
ncbi:hypothetical protein OPU39_17475 [Acinetobacter nosocomialis]|nr:hypothetical protein [Acinetobacter nosocomialis]